MSLEYARMVINTQWLHKKTRTYHQYLGHHYEQSIMLHHPIPIISKLLFDN